MSHGGADVSAEIDALQLALAGEHAAIWGYGEVGARSVDTRVPEILAVQQTHRVRRDLVEGVLLGAGATPVASDPVYALPSLITDPVSALRVAALIEDGVAATWRYVLGRTTTTTVRTTAGEALTTTAVQALRWRVVVGDAGPTTTAFPGI